MAAHLPPLLRLPVELHHLIIARLVFPETTHLRATNRHFASLIPPQPSTYLDLAAADSGAWATRRRRLACAYCARMRPARRFADAQKERAAAERACRDCEESYRAAVRWPARWPYVPRETAPTRYTDDRRVVVGGVGVDWVAVGVCKWCRNGFARWGGRTADRRVCRECPERPWAEVTEETGRLFRDLERLEKGAWWSWEWDDFNWWDMEDLRCPMYDYWFEWDMEYWDGRQVWADEHRGVYIRAREGDS
ncbi:hypothetical protein B0T10DRAFT_497862 [Neofusicoccum parvum]|nr:hypothetical protein B0T10DRAFT_497862 [Neofusicoccum parvum]